jgi:rSAM/selenodomain-associated transferase 1
MTHVLVMAKAPVAGRVKTRLCPPCTPAEAAAIAEAALADTLDAVAACGAGRRIVALDGAPGPWLPPGFEVVPQVDGGLDRRLAAAWSAAGGVGVQIGMDTPQVTPALLDHALESLDDTSAALGLAVDGGWWAIGLRRPDPRVFLGIAMSTDATGADQLTRLRSLGLSVTTLPALVDLDTAADLPAVTESGSAIRTAAQARRIGMLAVATAV